MAKRRTKWTQAKYDDFLKNRNWEYEGKEYIPFLSIQSFSSNGRISRIKSFTSKRIHHFFSDIQTRYFYILDWVGHVSVNGLVAEIVDIREHYPLVDLDIIDTSGLRLDKFVDKESKVPYVLTTTFLLTLKSDEEIFYIARSVKSKQSLEKQISIEKFAIEKKFWESKNIDFKIVTEKDYSKVLAENIAWFCNARNNRDDYGYTEAELETLSKVFLEELAIRKIMVNDFNHDFETVNNLEEGDGLFFFKYLLAMKRISVNLLRQIDITKINTSDIEIEKEDQNGIYK